MINNDLGGQPGANYFRIADDPTGTRNFYGYQLRTIGMRLFAGVQQLIAAAGTTVVYLPPYSPDLNPIEQCWAKIKEILRSVKARSADLLEYVVAEAMRCISSENASAWFRHCGYGL